MIKYIFRLLAFLGLPIFCLLLLEAGLRIGNVGYPTSFFIKSSDGSFYEDNPHYAWQYFRPGDAKRPQPFLMPVKKGDGVFRVFVLGESAAQGTPAPAFGFARQLEVMLREQYPGRRFEIINAAMRGINSHVITAITRECVQHEPDLFVVYMGNNELVGLHAPEPTGFNWAAHPLAIRVLQSLKATRTSQLLMSIAGRMRPETETEGQDAAFFQQHRLAADNPRRQPVYDNFRENLESILASIETSGARALVCTVPVNQKDCPPLGSLHRRGMTEQSLAQWRASYQAGIKAEEQQQYDLAATLFQAALPVDDHFADLHYRLARCLNSLGKASEARQHYQLARDWDALQFRADARINQIIRDTTGHRAAGKIELVDVEQAFAHESGELATPGERFFYEHVHLRFDGDYLVAKTLFPKVIPGAGNVAQALSIPTREWCAERLAFSRWDELDTKAAMVHLTSQAAFQAQADHDIRQKKAEQQLEMETRNFLASDFEKCQALYEQALAQSPQDWQIAYNFASLYHDFQNYTNSLKYTGLAIKLMPHAPAPQLLQANSLYALGKKSAAEAQLLTLLSLDKNLSEAQDALIQINRNQPSDRRQAFMEGKPARR